MAARKGWDLDKAQSYGSCCSNVTIDVRSICIYHHRPGGVNDLLAMLFRLLFFPYLYTCACSVYYDDPIDVV